MALGAAAPVAAADAPATLYAYADGSGTTAGGPSTADSASGCSLTEPLAEVAAGDTVVLATSPDPSDPSTFYVGNFSLDPSGTTARGTSDDRGGAGRHERDPRRQQGAG